MKKIKSNVYLIIILGLLILIIYSFMLFYDKNYSKPIDKTTDDIVDSVLDDDIISISFVGDLILLENQVKAGYNGKYYNYNKMFQYTKDYFSDVDYTIGVLEGPVMNGSYSVGNFNDNKNIYLNFPREFLYSIKGSGIDFVTISNNHILDKGLNGPNDTVKNLNDAGIEYTGYKDNYKIVDIKGLRVGIVAYTYGTNWYSEQSLYNLDITNMIVPPSSSLFERVKNEVINDFNDMKKENVDLIIVLPHMGTQFALKQNNMQNTWNKIFADNGASIIFGDHSHSVQPLEYINDTLVVNSPGNFANQYTDYNGDATAIVEVYVDKNSKRVINSSVIPMFTKGDNKGFYYSIPIYDIMTNMDIYNSMSNTELNRIDTIQKLITRVMLNKEISLDDIERKYYFTDNGYLKNSNVTLDISEDLKNTNLYKDLESSRSVCFIGDSITEGTVNNYHGWYEALINNFDIDVINMGFGSYTTKLMLNKKNDIINCSSDINIIALGTNDIRYRNENSAMTSNEYISNIKKITDLLDNKIVLIAPWYSMNYDKVTNLNITEKNRLFDEYSEALRVFALENNYGFINPNEDLKKFLNNVNTSFYLKDYIHPNGYNGVYLYSKVVLENSY